MNTMSKQRSATGSLGSHLRSFLRTNLGDQAGNEPDRGRGGELGRTSPPEPPRNGSCPTACSRGCAREEKNEGVTPTSFFQLCRKAELSGSGRSVFTPRRATMTRMSALLQFKSELKPRSVSADCATSAIERDARRIRMCAISTARQTRTPHHPGSGTCIQPHAIHL